MEGIKPKHGNARSPQLLAAVLGGVVGDTLLILGFPISDGAG